MEDTDDDQTGMYDEEVITDQHNEEGELDENGNPKEHQTPASSDDTGQQSQQSGGPSAEDIAAAVTKGMQAAQGGQQQQQEPEKELTQEEIDQYLKRAKYTAEDLKSLGFVSDEDSADEVDRKVKTFSDLQRRAIQEAVTTAQLLVQHQSEQMQQNIQPIAQHVQQQRQEELKNQFYETYPALKEYEQLVTLSANELSQSGQTEGKSNQEIFDLVASKASQYVKQFGGKELDLKATPKSQSSAGKVPQPASKGGTGGRSQMPSNQGGGNKTPSEFDIYDNE